MKSFKQFVTEAVSPHDIALTKREQLMLRDNVAAKLRIDQKRVAYQQILGDNRTYLVIYFVAEVPDLEIDDAEFRAKMVAKSAEQRAKKMFDDNGDKVVISTTFKVIEPRQGRSIKIKHKVTPA